PESIPSGREASELIERSPRDNGTEAGPDGYPGTQERDEPDHGRAEGPGNESRQSKQGVDGKPLPRD
ncbi:MAG TPA: hypothetical protein VHN99_04420, partial [Deinococcales bacterium]|nr:hypothetical protein [Deinococcales bacterium]